MYYVSVVFNQLFLYLFSEENLANSEVTTSLDSQENQLNLSNE